MGKRVVVLVPGAEGGWIVRAFQRDAIDAVRVEPEEVPGDDAVLVIDRETPGLARWLQGFDGDAILVGWEAPSEEELAAIDVVAFYPRPVHLAGLIRRVQTLLGGEALPSTPGSTDAPSGIHPPAEPTRPEPTQPGSEVPPAPGATLSEPERAAPVIPVAPGPLTPPRPTMAAPPDPDDPGAESFAVVPREPTVRLTAEGESALSEAREGASTRGDSSVPPPVAPPAEGEPSIERVVLSSRLAGLLEDADRRLFPNDAPLELTFPAGDEPPDVLVPDDLLAESTTPLEPREADPLEAFTFVGTPDLLDTASGSVPGERKDEGSVELTPHTVVERASRPPGATSDRPPASATQEPRTHESVAGTTGGVDLTRAGTVPAGGALRMVFELVERRRPCRVRLMVPGGPEVELHLQGDVVLGVRGPRHERALVRLVRAGRLGPLPVLGEDREARAAEALDDALRRGAITPFERDRELRLATEELVGEALLASEARYAVERADRGAPESSPLAGTLRAIALEEARRRLDAPTVLRWLGVDDAHRLELERAFSEQTRALGLEPELAAAFVRGAGQSLAELFDAPPLAGMPGALFALASADLVRFQEPAQRAAATRKLRADALAATIERARALAEDAPYHEVLGVDLAASPRVLAEAHGERTRALTGALEPLGLERLEPARTLALAAIDEAYEVLSHPRWGQLVRSAHP